MTEQNMIPADKVRELIEKFEREARNFPSEPERVVSEFASGLRALLPAPPQPTSGLLGRWAKHDDYGDVLCMWDRPDPEGKMHVRWVDESFPMATGRYYVPLSDLTFPHQTTRPEDVQPGEAWLVDLKDNISSAKNLVALKRGENSWQTAPSVTGLRFWRDEAVTLISLLTPERPGKDDLQAKYDVLVQKYEEAQEKIKTLEQPSPVWRIEHDWRNLRGDEYIIDKNGDPVVTETKHWAGEPWYTDSLASFVPEYARFIVFPNKDVATPEAIEEAMKERDKERGK